MNSVRTGIQKMVSNQTCLCISYPKKIPSYNLLKRFKYWIQDFHYESGIRGILPDYRRHEFSFDSIRLMDQFYDYGKMRGKASASLKIGENLELLTTKVSFLVPSQGLIDLACIFPISNNQEAT